MARPLKPFIRGGGYYPSRRWTPLIYPGGYTTMNGGEPPIPIEWKTVIGSAPLTFSDALSNKIRSLIQYGKCTTVDGEPYCNNGKMTAVDDELPSGYKRLLGITFDGNFHYRTGEALTGDDDVTMTLDNLSAGGKNVFGSYNGANDKNFSLYIYGSSTSGSYFRYGDQLKRPKYGGTGRRTITFGASGTSGFAEDSDVTPDEFTTPANTYIGMLPNSSSAVYTGDIVGSITVSNRLEWIPTERESDGVIGYYEKFNGNFIAPTGSGTPVSLGYDTSHLTVLSVEGTPEVLAVGRNLVTGATYGGFVRAGNPSAEKPQGSIQLVSGWCYTDYLPVEPETAYRTMVQAFEVATGAGLCFYEEETVESCLGGVTCQRQRGEVYDFETPENCHYVRFSWKSKDTDKGQMYLLSECQSASVVDLFSDGTVHDEQDIISGTVTRRTEVSASGGVVTVSALSTPVTQTVPGQTMHTVDGTNTVSVTSNVDPVDLSVEYATVAGD